VCFVLTFVCGTQPYQECWGPYPTHAEGPGADEHPAPQDDFTDVTGVAGMRIILAILDGERDPIKLAQLRHTNARSSEETIAKSLEGDWRGEHLFSIRREF
jgi:hypothetical protein